MRFDPSEHWMPTKNGKFVARPDWKCPKCYEMGEIVSDYPVTKTLELKRKCLNSECNKTYGEQWEWLYSKPWNEYTKQELIEYKKRLEEKGGSEPEFAMEKVKEILKAKYQMKL